VVAQPTLERSTGTIVLDAIAEEGRKVAVVAFDYQLFKPLTLTARTYFTKFIDPAPDIDNRMQVRLQLDAQIRF